MFPLFKHYNDHSIDCEMVKTRWRTGHFALFLLPRLDAIAEATEALIVQYNPAWSAHGYAGETAPRYPGLEAALHYCGYFYYDENITFSRADWRGRIRASRGIGGSLSNDEVAAFDNA